MGSSLGNRLILNLNNREQTTNYCQLQHNLEAISTLLHYRVENHGKQNHSYLWSLHYWDNNTDLLLFEINSHQLTSNGAIKNPLIPLAPSALFVRDNHVPDTMCSMTMGTYKHNILTLVTCLLSHLRYPLHVNHFGFSYDQSWIDGDTTQALYRAFHNELIIRHAITRIHFSLSRPPSNQLEAH